jgi:hypothetical protein
VAQAIAWCGYLAVVLTGYFRAGRPAPARPAAAVPEPSLVR